MATPTTPPKVQTDMTQAGGRHYKGRGLGALQVWSCPACAAQNTGLYQAGCSSCGAGAPGQQVRKPGEAVPDGAAAQRRTAAGPVRPAGAQGTGSSVVRGAVRGAVPPSSPPHTRHPLRIQRPAPLAVVDYDEIERRVARVLDARGAAGLSPGERTTIYLALTVYIGAWEDSYITPEQGLSLEGCRALAARLMPEDLESELAPAAPPQAEEAETDGYTSTTSESADTGASSYREILDASIADAGGAAGDTNAGDTASGVSSVDDGNDDGNDDIRF